MQYAAVPTGLSGHPRCYHSCEYIEDRVFLIGGLNHLQQLHGKITRIVIKLFVVHIFRGQVCNVDMCSYLAAMLIRFLNPK